MSLRALALGVLVCGCSSGLRRPVDQNVNLTGTVYLGGTERRGDPLDAATITVTRAADGSELATATSSTTGGYRLAFAAQAGTRVVIAFRSNNLVPNFRALVVGPYTEAQVSVALEPPEPVECTDSSCVAASDDLGLRDVPDNLIGRARVFEPSTETPRLAGLEALRPVVVAWYQLDAGPADPDAGVPLPLEDAGVVAPSLRVRIPFVAWRRVEDARPGTAAIEVPFLRFDEARGSWAAQAEGTLETEYGLQIPESALQKIREGQFTGGVAAVAQVTRAGYWAIALPAAAPGCISGTVEADGRGADGALVSLEGSEPVASSAGGTFCAAAPVGGGGPLFVQYAGLGYSGGTAAAPTVAGTCGGTCAAAGKLSVTGEALKAAKVCKISGKTVDGAGTAVTGAVVLGFDETLGGNAFNALCGKLGTRCTLSTSSDEKGEFTLNVPLLSGLTVTSTALVEKAGFIEASRRGTVLLRECPTGALQLRLLAGRDRLDLKLMLAGALISWAPARPAVSVRVVDALGAVKWELEALGGVPSPVTYGVVPAGAVQLTSGAPAALVAGDEVGVLLDGTGGDGYQYSGSAAAVVP